MKYIAFLIILVKVHGQCPFLEDLPQNVTVRETDGAGTDVLSFDNGGETSPVTFDVTMGVGNTAIPTRRIREFFNIVTVNTTSTLLLTKALDLEALTVIIGKIDRFTLRFQCENQVYETDLIISAVDEFFPFFNGAPYTLTVREDLEVGSVVFSLSENVGDFDVMSDSNKVFSLRPYKTISEFDGRHKFTIPESGVGDIVLLSQLDYEWMQENGRQFYMLNVSVQDEGGHTTYTTVKLIVTDADDLGPVFEYNGCEQPCEHISLLTHTTVNYTGVLSLPPIVTRDQDTLDSSVMFRLVTDEELTLNENKTYFVVDPSNGSIYQTIPLFGTNSSVFLLTLEAVEVTSNRSITANVTIIVIDRVETTTTTPPVPQRSDISCNADTIDTFVPISMLPSGAPLTWRDPSCKVTSNGTHMISSIGHNQCGTTVTITKDTVEFENELTAQISNHSANTLIDFGENSYVIPVKCIYPRTETPMTSYVPLQQHVRFYEKRYGHFDVDITQYDSDKFSSAIQSLGVPRKVALNTEIFVEVKMNDQFNNGLGIHVDKCIATPSPSPSDSTYYNLLTDGCPASQHVQLYNAPANKVRFGVRAFQFTTHNSSIVYIHCQTSMCEVGTPYCVSNCVTAGRRKRDVAPDQKSHLVSTGPFVFVADEQDNPIRMSTIVASVSLFVAVVACVAAVMGWTRKKTHTSTKEEGLL